MNGVIVSEWYRDIGMVSWSRNGIVVSEWNLDLGTESCYRRGIVVTPGLISCTYNICTVLLLPLGSI